MACLREQTVTRGDGIVQCNEEGCQLRSHATRGGARIDNYPPETDCVLQLRLRAGDTEGDWKFLGAEASNALDGIKRWGEMAADIRTNPDTCLHKILAVWVNSVENSIIETGLYCISCETDTTKLDIHKERLYEYDIDNNVWIHVPNRRVERTQTRTDSSDRPMDLPRSIYSRRRRMELY